MQSGHFPDGPPKEVFLVQDGSEWRVYWKPGPAKSMRTIRRNWCGPNSKPVAVWRATISTMEEVPPDKKKRKKG